MTRPWRSAPLLILTCATAGGAVLLAACGSSAATGSSAGAAGTSSSAPGRGARSGFGAMPAAYGVIAQITGRTLEVQNSTQQNAVTYTTATRFTEQRSAKLSSIKVGSCIVATAASGGTTASPTAPLTAVRVQITGSGTTCGVFGGAGSRSGTVPFGRSGFPSRPSGLPSAARSGLPGGGAGARFAGRVVGTVTAVSGDTITVRSVDRQRPAVPSATPSGAPASASSTPSTVSRAVDVTGTTTYTTTAATTATSLRVGLCALVQGTTGSTGAVAARSIALSPKTGSTCDLAGGFGGRTGGFGGAPAGGASTSG